MQCSVLSTAAPCRGRNTVCLRDGAPAPAAPPSTRRHACANLLRLAFSAAQASSSLSSLIATATEPELLQGPSGPAIAPRTFSRRVLRPCATSAASGATAAGIDDDARPPLMSAAAQPAQLEVRKPG